MFVEVLVNMNSMIYGIFDDWNYVFCSLYMDFFFDLKVFVNEIKEDFDLFYCLENLDLVLLNDLINYGYSGISLFFFIRNCNFFFYLDILGFCLRGINLNICYNNNILLMDGFIGIKYNIFKNESMFSKYGFC